MAQHMREFNSGATRNDDAEQPEYAGFFSPLSMKAYGKYMHKHRKQADGKLRSSRNWRKGIPIEAYEESLVRHVLDIQLFLEGYSSETRDGFEDALCAIIFNAQGMLHEYLIAMNHGEFRGRTE